MGVPITDELVEDCAKALFELLFKPGTVIERLDGNHLWATAEDRIKQGFRDEARVVLRAANRHWASTGPRQ